jgi:MerR family transcriptional regulator/heat shock protein HspR
MKKRVKTYTISAVAEMFEIHPQTLRMYEREGLLKPSRSEGNTRLYEDSDIERLEIILNMREKMDAMQREFERFFEYLRNHASELSRKPNDTESGDALVPVSRLRRTLYTEVSIDDD